MRKQTKSVMVKNVQIGGGAPVAVQSMTKTDTTDVDGTIRQIEEMAASRLRNRPHRRSRRRRGGGTQRNSQTHGNAARRRYSFSLQISFKSSRSRN